MFSIEWRQCWQDRAYWLQAVLFSLLFAFIYSVATPVAQSPAHATIITMLGLVFSSQYTIDHHLRLERWQGCWQHYRMGVSPLWQIIFIKAICLVSLILLPLIAVLPLIALIMNIDLFTLTKLLMFLVSAGPAWVLITLLAASMTLALPQASTLIPLIVIPIGVPIILLGQSAIVRVEFFAVEYYFLAAVSILALTFVPLAVASIIHYTGD